MLSSLVFRAVRNALPGNPEAQERIIGASLFAMAVADVRASSSSRLADNSLPVAGYSVSSDLSEIIQC